MVLVIWELIPTLVIVFLFRLKQNNTATYDAYSSLNSSISVKRSVFFETDTNEEDEADSGSEEEQQRPVPFSNSFSFNSYYGAI